MKLEIRKTGDARLGGKLCICSCICRFSCFWCSQVSLLQFMPVSVALWCIHNVWGKNPSIALFAAQSKFSLCLSCIDSYTISTVLCCALLHTKHWRSLPTDLYLIDSVNYHNCHVSRMTGDQMWVLALSFPLLTLKPVLSPGRLSMSLVMEYLPYGSLIGYLESNRHKVNARLMLRYTSQICKVGVSYEMNPYK